MEWEKAIKQYDLVFVREIGGMEQELVGRGTKNKRGKEGAEAGQDDHDKPREPLRFEQRSLCQCRAGCGCYVGQHSVTTYQHTGRISELLY